jgi:hypothetical protein
MEQATPEQIRAAVEARDLSLLKGFVVNARWLGYIEGRQSWERESCEVCDATGYAWDESIPDEVCADDKFVPCSNCNKQSAPAPPADGSGVLPAVDPQVFTEKEAVALMYRTCPIDDAPFGEHVPAVLGQHLIRLAVEPEKHPCADCKKMIAYDDVAYQDEERNLIFCHDCAAKVEAEVV